MQKKSWQTSLTIVFVLLGILLSAQMQTQNRLLSDLSMQKSTDLISMVRDLSDKRYTLAEEINETKAKLDILFLSEVDESQITDSLSTELDRLQILTGELPVTGKGIEVVIEEDDFILYEDVISIINELWAAGAEAVSINDQRVTLHSSFYYTESKGNIYITHNQRLLDYPIRIKSIGNPTTLEKGLTLPGGIMDNLAVFFVVPEIKQRESIVIPAIKQQPKFQYGSIPPKTN